MRIVLSLGLRGERWIWDPPTSKLSGTRAHQSKRRHSSSLNLDCSSGPTIPIALRFRSLVVSEAQHNRKRPCYSPPILWVAFEEQIRTKSRSHSPLLHPLPSPTRHPSPWTTRSIFSKGENPCPSFRFVLDPLRSIRRVRPGQKGEEKEGLMGTNRIEPNDACERWCGTKTVNDGACARALDRMIAGNGAWKGRKDRTESRGTWWRARGRADGRERPWIRVRSADERGDEVSLVAAQSDGRTTHGACRRGS